MHNYTRFTSQLYNPSIYTRYLPLSRPSHHTPILLHRTSNTKHSLFHSHFKPPPSNRNFKQYHQTAAAMALPPKFSGQLLSLTPSASSTASATNPHTLELYLDYVCPFSAKLFLTFTSKIVPLIRESYTTPGIRIIFRQQIQPWHPSSTLVHEAAAAVLQVAPDEFWPFSEALMKAQKDYFDVNVVNETRNRTYERLAKLAGSVGVDEKKVYDLLVVSDKPSDDGSLNIGNGVTNDVKFMVKANRVTGVHVTPSVMFNGVMESSISSSWAEKEWSEWLKKNAT